MKMKPVEVGSPGLLIEGVSTWGGAAVQTDDGDWHMFAARVPESCGLDVWVPNSEIAHARSSVGPAGPYVPTPKAVLPSFSHGPKVTTLPDGTLIMPHIGCGDLSTPIVTGCTNGTTPAGLPPRNFSRSNCNQAGWTGVLTASSVAGPWEQQMDHAGHGLSVQSIEGAWHKVGGGLTNPQFWPIGNGSIVLAYSMGCEECFDAGHKHSGLAIGTLESGFRDLTPLEPIWPWAVEDPSVFFDADSGYWHVIGHRTSNDGPGAENIASHAVAKSLEGPWKLAMVEPFDRDLVWQLANGTVVTTHVQKRERPQIIVDRAGQIVALSSGVRTGKWITPVSPGGYTGDWTFTHVQLFDRKATTQIMV